MGLISKTRKFFKAPSRSRILLIEGFWTSLKYEYYLRKNKYNPVKHLHKDNDDEKISGDISKETISLLRATGNVMKIIEKHAPWKPMCYNRAMTAKKMLISRNIKTKMHIGFRKKDNEFDGHAWLTYNDILVTGKIKGLHSFKELKAINA